MVISRNPLKGYIEIAAYIQALGRGENLKQCFT